MDRIELYRIKIDVCSPRNYIQKIVPLTVIITMLLGAATRLN